MRKLIKGFSRLIISASFLAAAAGAAYYFFRKYVKVTVDGTDEEEASDSADLPIMTVVYGRQRLMLLHHCPARTALGLTKGHRDCRMCDEGSPEALAGQTLEDRKGYRFPLLRQRLPEGCMVQLMNVFPTDNIINSEFIIHNSELRERGTNRALVFTTETRNETEAVLEAFKEGRKTKGETTGGHWKRPVE